MHASLFRSLLALSMLAIPLVPGAAFAVVFKVNLTQDVPDIAPGDGICSYSATLNPNQFATCSLRAAVMEGNATPPPQDVDIVLVPGATYKFTRVGADENEALTGDLDISRPMRIGVPESATSKARIDANTLDRAFYFFNGAASSELHGLEILGGYRADGTGTAVQSKPSVTLTELDIHHGTRGDEPGADCAVSGGIVLIGTRIHHNGTKNHAMSGICNSGGSLTVVASTIDHNSSEGLDIQGDGNLWLHNSTVAENVGRGIFLLNASAVIYASTVANNGTDPGYVTQQIHFGSTIDAPQSLNITGSIIGGRAGSACDIVQPESTFSSAWNIYSDASCVSDTFFDNSRHNATINLSELGDFGGPTPTMIPLAGSDAIDFAPEVVCNQTDTDQRGLPRPVSTNGGMPRCDAGAVELQAAPPVEPLPGPIFSDGFEDAI